MYIKGLIPWKLLYMQILLIEDDQKVAEFIINGLKPFNINVEHINDGLSGLEKGLKDKFDAMVIDRMLPSLEGLQIIERLRMAGVQTPVLVLSALADVDDRIAGLQAGGDDYLTKPFVIAELAARLEAMTRRNSMSVEQTKLQVADLQVDLLTQKVFRGDQSITLQPREYKLLEYLLRNLGQVVTRDMLLEHVWEYSFDPQTNVIDVHVSRLRQKIDKGFDKQLLVTVRGAGYMLRDPG